MGLEQKLFSCNEHIDIAMEEFINDYEKSPNLIESNGEKCSYCKEISKYEVK